MNSTTSSPNDYVPNDYVRAYFRVLTQLREHIFYITEYIQYYERIDFYVNIVLAIASNTSIGAWAIWQTLNMLWGIIIALSQIITAIKPFLPFKKTLTFLYPLRNKLELLALEIEQEWFKVSQGKLTEEEIHNLTCKFKSQKTEIEHEIFKNKSLPENKQLIQEARKSNKYYFENSFNIRR